MTKEDVIKEFTRIKGFGKAKSELLYKNGFDSIEKLKKAKIKDLEKIDGITNTDAKNILKQFTKESEIKKTTKTKKEKAKDLQKKVEKKKPSQKVKIEKKEEKQKEIKIEKEEEKIKTKEEKMEYKTKIKPKLNKELQNKLRIRKQIKNRTPEFLREEWFRYGKISKSWRKPDGMTSKMRLHKKYRQSVVRVGYRGPKNTRGLHSSGFEEVFVFNVNDLTKIDPNKQAARIGGSVGTKKRLDIQKKAEELEIRILNL